MATVTETKLGSLIQRKPRVNGGRPCLAGTGLSVQQISVLYNEGLTPEEILERYDFVDLPRIYAAVAYYLANKDWIDAEMAADEAAYLAEVERRRAAAAGR